MSRLTRIGTIAAGLLVSSAILSPAQAASATSGLFGTTDPTYDGVFRQSLAVIGLSANGVQPAADAVDWLLRMQCMDGGFQEYRTDLAKPCTPPDPATFTGEDTNATAAALAAFAQLRSTGKLGQTRQTAIAKAADRAAAWLRRAQNPDGGWPQLPGTPSDANSTGVTMAALAGLVPDRGQRSIVRATRFLQTVQVPCGSATGGALMWQAGNAANDSATAQGFVGLVPSVPVPSARSLSGTPACSGAPARKAASYLARTLNAKGFLPSALGGGIDTTSTAYAVIGLESMGVGRSAVGRAVGSLAAQAKSKTTDPGALGLLLMVAKTTDHNPRSFGGVDLVSALQTLKQ